MSNTEPIKNPLVSIIVPMYNMESYIEETLHSILSSDYHNIEVVVIDDGSTDRSYEICCGLAKEDNRLCILKQKNSGVCAARNKAIDFAHGEFILPVDSDDLIEPTFVSEAIEKITSNSNVKVVAPKSDFFGDRQGEWKLPKFSLKKLAHKNIMAACALYRKSDWTRVGGYCEEIIAREDWEFWISILKDGGEVIQLDNIVLHYRVHKKSKRISDRKLKGHVINILNKRHPEFFYKYLGGPLRFQRSWSHLINIFSNIYHSKRYKVSSSLPVEIQEYMKVIPVHYQNDGKIIYKGRNELRELTVMGQTFIVKSFKTPNIINKLVYGFIRSSKAERSYLYAQILIKKGFNTPEPIAYYTTRNGLFFNTSFYVSRKSQCAHTYKELPDGEFIHRQDILKAIGKTTAKLHEAGVLHTDYSQGNLLFNDEAGDIPIDIIDLNRIRFRKVSIEDGCKNFERLPGNEDMFKIMATSYAKYRGADPELCFRLIFKSTNH